MLVLYNVTIYLDLIKYQRKLFIAIELCLSAMIPRMLLHMYRALFSKEAVRLWIRVWKPSTLASINIIEALFSTTTVVFHLYNIIIIISDWDWRRKSSTSATSQLWRTVSRREHWLYAIRLKSLNVLWKEVLGVPLKYKIRNKWIHQITKVNDIALNVSRLKWQWTGHTCLRTDYRTTC